MDLLLLLVDTSVLSVHEQRYNKGKYRAMFYRAGADRAVIEELQGGDDGWAAFEYSLFKLSWFPFGDADTLTEAVKILEDKVNAIPEELQDKFYNVFTALMDHMALHPYLPPRFIRGHAGSDFDDLATLDENLFISKLKEIK